ncbi:RluA family pseudouridine synthase [Subdoligranulum sp. DSM 109015]|uniref:RNA pseudouridylate synthase n=1 Tax=Gemmiger gallinarum TaxID=2779354 RepID=A0ABR9QZL6_9FIRM|nr:RluA family pseudouridine synthase [Gemmiger gallinarum]MBE5036320.1 RluA family pseudouridine synthase [Gemmiger gallinarum]
MLYLACRVPSDAQGCRLDSFLRGQGLSAGLIRAVKHQCGGFFADGAPIHTNMPLTAGQELTFALPSDPPTQVEPQPVAFGILFEDAFAAVLDKPAGLAVHPTLNYPDRTLANGWLWHLEQKGQTGVFRPVNRIDKNTSGLVLCAGNSFAAPILAATAHKCYLAVTEGLLPEDDGVIDAPIARRGDSIIGRTVAPEGKPSVTRYRVLARGGGHTLAACIPVTGRTHQIRVHMAHLGCPLAGDTLYGGHTGSIDRHALHCAALTFRHPLDGSLRRIQCPLPPDMAQLCRACGMPPVEMQTLFALIQELSPEETGVEPKTPFAYFIREND